MADVVADAIEWLKELDERERTHSDECHKWHPACLVARLVMQIERLRLTDAERVAVLWAIASLETDPDPDGGQDKEAAGILKEMLDRMQKST